MVVATPVIDDHFDGSSLHASLGVPGSPAKNSLSPFLQSVRKYKDLVGKEGEGELKFHTVELIFVSLCEPLTMSGRVCDFDSSPALVVAKKTLTVQNQDEPEQRTNLFHTKAGMQGKSIKVIIDDGSCHNLASQELCDKLGLKLEKHPHPYHVQWLSECGTVKVRYTTKVTFQIGAYADTVECDVEHCRR